MLKKMVMCALSALWLLGTELQALPVGNPLDASNLCTGIFWDETCCNPCGSYEHWCQAWNLRIGYYGDFVFNRRLEVNRTEFDATIRKTQLFTNAAYLAVNLCNRFDVFSTFGSSKLYLETPATAFPQNGTYNNSTLHIELDGKFSWSLGARATIWECGCFGFGAEAQYFSYKSDIKYAYIGAGEPAYVEDAGVRFREYQVGVGATYKIPICDCKTFVVPYAAIKWDHAKMNFGNFIVTTVTRDQAQEIIFTTTSTLVSLVSQNDFGWVVGATLVGCCKWSITAEARFFGETACHINSQLRF